MTEHTRLAKGWVIFSISLQNRISFIWLPIWDVFFSLTASLLEGMERMKIESVAKAHLLVCAWFLPHTLSQSARVCLSSNGSNLQVVTCVGEWAFTDLTTAGWTLQMTWHVLRQNALPWCRFRHPTVNKPLICLCESPLSNKRLWFIINI